jgi:hypothetical protein
MRNQEGGDEDAADARTASAFQRKQDQCHPGTLVGAPRSQRGREVANHSTAARFASHDRRARSPFRHLFDR